MLVFKQLFPILNEVQYYSTSRLAHHGFDALVPFFRVCALIILQWISNKSCRVFENVSVFWELKPCVCDQERSCCCEGGLMSKE